jgi:hypothetical protein
MKNIIFWDMTPFSPTEVHQYFKNTAFIFRVNKSKQVRIKKQAASTAP